MSRILSLLRDAFATLGMLLRGAVSKAHRTERWHRLVQDRYLWVMTLLILAMVAIVLRILFFIYSAEGKMYRQRADNLARPQASPMLPLRGTIHAQDGRPVAVSSPVHRLFFDFRHDALAPLRDKRPLSALPAKVQAERKRLRRQFEDELDSLARLIDQEFDLASLKLTRQALKKRWLQGFQKGSRHWPVLGVDVPYVQMQQFQSVSPFIAYRPEGAKKAQGSLMKRVIFTEDETRRIYPFKSLAYRTIGQLYDRSDKEGRTLPKSGLERSYDKYLRGELGEKMRYANMRETAEVVTRPAVDGASVYTTLDMNIQSVVERNLREQLTFLDAQSGTVVLMEVKTGKVVAISNLQRTRSGGYAESTNMAVSDLSEPGSTFKVASMMVALDDGIVRASDTIDVGNGVWVYAKKAVRDHNAHHGGYGKLSVAQTIVKSSNVGLAKIITRGYESRPDVYVQKLRDLGFGTDLKLEIEGYARAQIRKRSDNPNAWYGTTLAWMSFGYETKIPPIYTLAFFNAIANGGRYMRPYFVTEIRRGDEILQSFAPQVVKEQICKPSTLVEIQEMLRRVVTEGTGKKALSPYVSISGKSGTAQLSSGKSYRDSTGHVRHQVSFCAYFPSEAPKYSCIAVIRQPSSQFSAGGGVMAAPIIRKIAESLLALEAPLPLDSLHRSASPKAYARQIAAGRTSALLPLLRQLGLPVPQVTKATSRYMQLDSLLHPSAPMIPQGKVPAVVGMSAMDAVYLLRSMGYTPVLRGFGNVVGQSVSAGSTLASGATIVLELGYRP